MRRKRANFQPAVWLGLDALQLGHTAHRDHPRWLDQAQVHQQHERRAAGHEVHVVAELTEQSEHLGQGVRLVELKWADHRRPTASRTTGPGPASAAARMLSTIL